MKRIIIWILSIIISGSLVTVGLICKRIKPTSTFTYGSTKYIIIDAKEANRKALEKAMYLSKKK